MATGEQAPAGEEGEAPSPFAALDRPVIALVADPTVALSDLEGKLEEVIFKTERLPAMKAFRTVRISPENAERDPVLQGKGKDVPRVLVVNPLKEDVKALEGGRLKAGTLYSEMKKVADSYYEEKLDALVKGHLKILTERDQLANEEKTLQDKEGRLAEEGDKSARDLAEVRTELGRVRKDLEGLATRERDLWKLTPKSKPA